MDPGDLQLLLASISAFFNSTRWSRERHLPVLILQARYTDTAHFSTFGDARQGTPLPPPPRYSRRPRPVSFPPKGPDHAALDFHGCIFGTSRPISV